MTWWLLLCLPAGDDRCSCAAASLYALLASAGHQVEVERVSALLPVNPKGHSLAEIQAAAKTLGVRLTATNLRDERMPPPKAPFILHLEPLGDEPFGHFVCCRPLDRTARQYQIIDPPKSTDVRTAEELAEDRRVSGWIVAVAPWWRNPWQAGLAGAGFGVFAWGYWRTFFKKPAAPPA